MANKERKDLNTTNGDLGNDYATSSVPISQRRGFFGTAMVWVGWCISLSAFLTGGTIGAGNTLWIGLLAVLAGNLLLFVLGSLCGVIGFRTGRTTYSLFEPMFGSKGSILVSVLRGASAMSFIGVLLNSFANTLTALLPWFPFWLAWILAFILSQLTKSAIPSVTAILFGFVLYIVFYYVLDIKLNIHKESLENPVNGEVWDMPTSKEVAAQIAQQEKAAQEK